ncbi:DNA-binding protein [Patescibacteria group bacterium]|nr:DNA-binding protein [Patescibacteria group bacterium]
MQLKTIEQGFILRLEQGEEITETITKCIQEQNTEGGMISGVGAAYNVTLQYFNMETKEYEEKLFPEEYEILALSGNISLKDGKPWPHLHIVLGTKNFQCIGGHLKSATVGATCEIVIQKFQRLERGHDDATGLHLLDLNGE